MSPIIVTNSSPAGRIKRVKAASGAVEPFFSDDFAGTQKNDANGFTWNAPSGDVTVVSFDGYDCLKFNYPALTAMAEQRFNYGQYVNAVWVEYYIHVPSNFTMRHTGTGWEGFNNKFFTTWRDTYSDFAGGTQSILQEFQNFSGTTIAEGKARNMYRRVDDPWTVTDIIGDTSNGSVMISASGPITIGAWNRVRFAFKGSSAFGVSDGHWKSQFNDTTIANLVNQPIYNRYTSPADVTFLNGYFMGYANTKYADATAFHIRNVKFYNVDPGWVF